LSLISSQYSSTGIEIAQASHRIAEESRKDNEIMRSIAELSRRDNQIMLQVAEDSKAVALATARDSATMRVIAGVTILFLPATFVAVSSNT
jgi:FixJ family two-component response regulator